MRVVFRQEGQAYTEMPRWSWSFPAGHSEAGAKSRTRPLSYARRQERKKATKAAATVTASGVNPVEISVVKSVRGVGNNADNAEEEVVKAGTAVRAVKNATEEASI